MARNSTNFNRVEEINSTFRGRTPAVTSKPDTAEAFIPVEAKKKRLGSFLMSFLSPEEEAEYEPEPPTQYQDWRVLDAKWAEQKKQAAEQAAKRKAEEDDYDSQQKDLEQEISNLYSKFFKFIFSLNFHFLKNFFIEKLEGVKGVTSDTLNCQLCNKYIAELAQTKVQRAQMGAHWYSKTRGKINKRATMHRESMHSPALAIEKQIKELELKRIQLYEKSITDRQYRERKRRLDEREAERRKQEAEEEFKKKEERRIKFQIEKVAEMKRWQREWEAQESERERDFNPEYWERQLWRYSYLGF